MTNGTATELVDLVEARIADEGEIWDFPLLIERLLELGDGERWDLSPDGSVKLLAEDLPMLRGLARVLAEALEQ